MLPDGSGPFTIATGIALQVGGAVTFAHVPSQKYTMSTADVVTAPGCSPGASCYDRIQATAHVEATSQGPDDGPQDDAPVQATATAPTFLLAPSTQLTLSASSTTINAGESVQWTVTETNDTPARYFPLTLTDAHVDLSTDAGATAFARLDATTTGFSGDNGDAQLAVGETWRWTFTTTPAADATLTATGFGTGARNRLVTFPADAEERAVSSHRRHTNNDRPTNHSPTRHSPTSHSPARHHPASRGAGRRVAADDPTPRRPAHGVPTGDRHVAVHRCRTDHRRRQLAGRVDPPGRQPPSSSPTAGSLTPAPVAGAARRSLASQHLDLILAGLRLQADR